MEELDAKFAKTQHERVGNFPRAWQLVASNLLSASQVLREKCESSDSRSATTGELGAVELMLRGMAIECLLKALWLKQGRALVKDGHFKGVAGAGAHDLPQLTLAVAFPLSDLEKDLLRRLSHFIEYGGRYPVPKDANKLRLTPAPGGGKASATTWSTPTDNQLFDALILRLDKLLA